MNTSAVEIRQAGTGDLEALVPLFDAYRQFYAQVADASAARAFLRTRFERGDSFVLIAWRDGEALGFTQLYPFPSSVRGAEQFVLNDLFVWPAVRGGGVATRLLEAARDFAARRGAVRLLLETGEDNPAQHLYERLGYVRETGFLHYALAL